MLLVVRLCCSGGGGGDEMCIMCTLSVDVAIRVSRASDGLL